MPDWGAGAKGALGGAAAGAALGPIGAGIGAGLGGLFGLFGGDMSPTNNYHQDPAQLDHTGYGGNISGAGGGFNAYEAQQSAYIKSLQDQAAGRGGPSPADIMLQQQTQRNAQASASAVASQRGLNPALGARMVLDQQAAGNQQAAGQGSLLRSQEQLQAQGLLGSALGQQGQQQLGMFGTAGGLQNAQNATTVQNVLGAGQINAGVAGGNAATNAGMIGGGLNALGGAAAHGGIGGGWSGFGGNQNANFEGGSGYSEGGKVPGHALSPGDAPRNDTVKAMLSPGEVVIPRSAAQDPDKARAFVQAIQRKKSGERKGYGKVLEHTQKARAALDALEKHVKGRAA